MQNLLLPAVMLTVILSLSAEARGLGKVFLNQHGQLYIAYPISNLRNWDVSNRSFVEFGID
jgi:hypothetical protein